MPELQSALKNMKNNKAPGIDGIPVEFYKYSPPAFLNILLAFYNKLFIDEVVPELFLKAAVCAVFKKGDPNQPENYRGISMLSTLRKVFTQILYYRLINWVESNNRLSMFQAGFRAGLPTVDQIFALESIARRYINKKKKLYAFFVDFRAAFDTINRNSLLYKLSMIGMSAKFMSL